MIAILLFGIAIPRGEFTFLASTHQVRPQIPANIAAQGQKSSVIGKHRTRVGLRSASRRPIAEVTPIEAEKSAAIKITVGEGAGPHPWGIGSLESEARLQFQPAIIRSLEETFSVGPAGNLVRGTEQRRGNIADDRSWIGVVQQVLGGH